MEINTKDDDKATPEDLFKALADLDISYELHHHDAVFSVEESKHIDATVSGVACRNLFLRDKKKKMFLIVAANETTLDLKKLSDVIDSGRLSFGSADRLWDNLGVRPGSVCPYSIMNDQDGNVTVILDKHMMDRAYQNDETVNYHPLLNTMTICVKPDDLIKFLDSYDHTPHILDLSAAAPD
jgi:Ala-tRNA(Pro) deacylase